MPYVLNITTDWQKEVFGDDISGKSVYLSDDGMNYFRVTLFVTFENKGDTTNA